MYIKDFLKKKISNIKNKFVEQKTPVILKKDLETMAYLKKI